MTFSHKFSPAPVKAFAFFEGVPKILVPDNLKSAVIKNTKHEIVLNENYKTMADHYGCVIEPARPYKPKDKSKAEQGVLAVQRWILAVIRHRKFFSVDELNIAISPLLDIYNKKIMKRLNKSREELFQELDKPYLKELPANRYIYKEFKIATVYIDYHITLQKQRYSVPFKYLKEKVEVQYSTSTVEIYHKSKLIATHPKYYDSGYSTKKEHMPLNHQYQEEKFNPKRYLSWAQSIGVNAVAFTKKKLEQEQYPSHAYRRLNAVLSLSKQYSKYELDLALGYALSINATTVVSIKSILVKKLYYKKVANNIINQALNNHENIRSNNEYK